MANPNTTAATACENIWSEYPEPRYWHDLIATPQNRPFYPFTRPCRQPAPPPVVKSRAQIREEEGRRDREARWREMQLYYFNACGPRRAQEQDVQVREGAEGIEGVEGVEGVEGEEGEERDTTYMKIAAKYREVWDGVARLLAKSKEIDKYDVLGTALLAIFWLHRLVILAAVIGVLTMLMMDLAQRRFGSMEEGKSVLEYVLVEKYRSWAVA